MKKYQRALIICFKIKKKYQRVKTTKLPTKYQKIHQKDTNNIQK